MASNFTALVCPTTECFSPGSQSASLGEKPFAWRLHAVAVFAFASAVWSYSVVRPQPAGLRRFLAAAPLVLCHFLIPFLLDRNEDIISLVTLTFSLTWLSSFKVTIFDLLIVSPQFRSVLALVIVPMRLAKAQSSLVVLYEQSVTLDSTLLLCLCFRALMHLFLNLVDLVPHLCKCVLLL